MATRLILTSSGVNVIDRQKAEAICLYYSKLFKEFNVSYYNSIIINHVDDNFSELVLRQGRDFFVNIKYDIGGYCFDNSSEINNILHLEIINVALLRVSDFEKKINIDVLKKIYNNIRSTNFEFEFVYKQNRSRLGIFNIIVKPFQDKFDYYLEVINESKSRVFLFSGVTSFFYINDLFYSFFVSNQSLKIVDRFKEMELCVNLDNYSVKIVNKTQYDSPPLFQIIKSDISAEDRDLGIMNYMKLHNISF